MLVWGVVAASLLASLGMVNGGRKLSPGLEDLLDDVLDDPYGRVPRAKSSEGVDPIDLTPSPQTCGTLNKPPCLVVPYCKGRLVVDENVVCVPCGNHVSAPPCEEEPFCDAGLTPMTETDECVPCGGQDQPVCQEDRVKCDRGLSRTTVQVDRYVIAERGTAAKCDG